MMILTVYLFLLRYTEVYLAIHLTDFILEAVLLFASTL
jgi:hypothetical protein